MNLTSALVYRWGKWVGELPWRLTGKELTSQCRRRVQSLGGKDPLEEAWATTPVFLLGKSHGQRSQAGYSPWGHRESDTTWRLNNDDDYAIVSPSWRNPLTESTAISPRFFAHIQVLVLLGHLSAHYFSFAPFVSSDGGTHLQGPQRGLQHHQPAVSERWRVHQHLWRSAVWRLRGELTFLRKMSGLVFISSACRAGPVREEKFSPCCGLCWLVW